MVKKIIALLLVAMLLGTGVAGLAESASTGVQRGSQIVVGSTSALSGYFSMDLWGFNTADMDARTLLHGYSTIAWANVYGMSLDSTVLADFKGSENGDGSQTFVMTLSPGLCYNDGTPITAQDYVFSLLMLGSPAIWEIGGAPADMAHIVGYAEYRTGQRGEVSGIRMLDNQTFSITIGADYLNYFYALALLNVTPYPIHVIAPGCAVYDDGRGAYIGATPESRRMSAEGYTPGEFGAEMLQKTLLDPVTGYVFNPRVTSGPYSLESYNPVTHEARFVINERYVGDYQGQRPFIERIVYRPVANDTMIGELASGKVDLLNKVTSGVPVGEGLMANQDGLMKMGNYLRTGFAFLSFACEQGVTSSVAVRKAIGYCIDKQAFVANVIGTFNAMPVYGYYGLGQWMVGQTFEAAPGKDRLVVLDELSKLEQPYDPKAAAELLRSDGWTLNEAGDPYDENKGGTRHRKEADGTLTPLVIRWAKSEDSTLAESTRQALTIPLGAVGIRLEVTEMPFTEMLTHYYRQTEREYDMFFLASNFGYIFDPYYDFNTGEIYQGLLNTTGLRDETLMNLARDMRETHPTELREYTEKWFAFQERWVDMMPMVPLYSNVYFDFYSNRLQDYAIAEHTSWASAILYAWIHE